MREISNSNKHLNASFTLFLLITFVNVGFHDATLTAQQLPDSVISIDSLTVTVLRGSDAINQTPYAISIRDQIDLQRGNTGLSLEEALQGIPGVQVQNRYNYAVGERISIRGFGARAGFGVRGVKVIVDGIPATMADGQSTLDHVDIGSLGRAEVLRGPASALYGNGSGGVLSLQTAEPPDVPFRQIVKGVIGSNGLTRLESNTAGRYQNTSYLVNLSRLNYDGFRTNPQNPADPYGTAGRLNLNTNVSTKFANGVLRITGNVLDLNAQNPGSLNRSDLDAGVLSARSYNVKQNTYKDVRQGQLGLNWTGNLANMGAEFTTWGLFRNLDNPIPPRIIDLRRKAFGSRAVLSSMKNEEPGNLTWSIGTDLDYQRDSRKNFQNKSGAKGSLSLDQYETVSAIGFFAQGRTIVNEKISVMGGARYDYFQFGVTDHLTTNGNEDESGQRNMTSLSPTLGIHANLNNASSLYANLATSFATPTTTELANRPDGAGGFNSELNPQKGLTGEIGIRRQWSSRISTEFSAYRTSMVDELVPFEDALQPGRTFYRNAGSSTYQGFENSIQVVVTDKVFTRLSHTLVDATFGKFSVDDKTFDGNRIPGTPRRRLDGMVRFTEKDWYGEIRGDYVGSMAVNDSNSEFTNSYHIWELRGGFSEIQVGGFKMAPFGGVSNIFNTTYSAAVAVNAFGARFYEPGPKRAFYLGLSAQP